MKKLLALLLALALCLPLAACGGSGSSSAPAASSESAAPSESTPAESISAADSGEGGNSALNDVPLVAIPAGFESSIWEFAGGMVDNQEMGAEDAQQILDELFYGRLAIAVDSDGATMVFGTGDSAAMIPGTWEAEGNLVAMNFSEVGDLVACFTELDGETVMLLIVEEDITFYLTPLPTPDVTSALSDVQVIAVPDLYEGDAWSFAGALVDNKELEAAEAQAVLDELFGGSLRLVFQSTDAVDLVSGPSNSTVHGVWQVQDNVLGFGFYPDSDEPAYYTGCFTEVDGEPVLLFILDETGTNVLYLARASER